MAFNTPNTLHREEYLKKKRQRKLVRSVIIGASLVFIVGILSYISHRPNIRISEVMLSGGILVTQEDISRETLSFVEGKYLWLFPKNNVLWYPHKKLSNYLTDTFKRIDSIDIYLKDFHTLTIDITERKPIATWCDTLPNETPKMEDGSSVEQCYFIDQNSTVFATAPYFSGDAYFKYYGLITGDSLMGKQYISSSTKFTEIVDFVSFSKKLGIHPEYLIAKSDDEFSLVLSGGGQIYFDIKEPLNKVGENLEALLRGKEFSTSTSYNLPVEYIDLRYGNKLFYKLKE